MKPSNLLLWAELPSAPTEDTVPPLPSPSDHDPTEWEIRVANWEIAVGGGDTEAALAGTPGFAAPEQWHHPATPSADVFGLAATLYFLLTGKRVMPIAQEFVNKLLDGTARYCPPQPVHKLNPNVDSRLSRIIMTSLAIDPANRHNSADALANELNRWLNGLAVKGDSRARRAKLWVQRSMGVAVAASVMMALAAWATASNMTEIKARTNAAEAHIKTASEKELRAEAETKQAQAEAFSAKLQVELTKKQLQQEAEKSKQISEQTATARAAARRGDWPIALYLFDELIRDVDPATARRLRVERLFGYFAGPAHQNLAFASTVSR